MSTLGCVMTAALIAWCASEAALAVMRRSRPWKIGQDRLSYWVIWLSFLITILAALGVSKVDTIGRMALLAPFAGYAGCVVIAAGVATRWVAVATLGRQFALQVSIVEDHRMVDHGIYKRIRHPSYLGLLVSFVGFGLTLQDWISLSVALVLPLAAVLYRISVEQKVLLVHFGARYEEYCRRTKRLLPGVY